MRILMLAPPGGGKGTQGIRIADTLQLEHISSGDLLRAEVANDTELGREVAGYMQRGRLAPDALVDKVVKTAISERDDYVLDGYPRTLAQAQGLDFDRVVYLDVPEQEIERRLLARGRADDTPEVIAARLRQYHSDTRPLIDHYRNQGVLLQVDGARPADAITADLIDQLRPNPPMIRG